MMKTSLFIQEASICNVNVIHNIGSPLGNYFMETKALNVICAK